jgi:hypothetical protein
VSGTVGLDFERQLHCQAAEVRRVLAECLREQGFHISSDLVTQLEAKRGSFFGSSFLLKKSMAVLAHFEVTSEAGGTVVRARLTDNIPTFAKTWGVNRIYHDALTEIGQKVDAALARIDDAAATGWPDARFWTRASNVPFVEVANSATARLGESAVDSAKQALERQSSTMPAAWKGVDAVTFHSSDGACVLSLEEVQAFLGVAVLVVNHPDSLDAEVAASVEQFAAELERRLSTAGGRAIEFVVPERYAPTFELLERQSEIRARLPMRELHICTTCRLEKITNPDYERIHSRNEKLGDIVAGVGATITSGGISPTFVLGQVFKLKRLDPEYVCSRCQGMNADERVVTFCPECGELAREVLLELCTKCGFDYGTRAEQRDLWLPEPPPPPPPAPAAPVVAPIMQAPVAQPPVVPVPPVAPAPAAWPSPALVPVGHPAVGARGKVCQSCGAEYPNLWRLVIQTAAGYEERFVCGTTARCQAPSLIAAFQV